MLYYTLVVIEVLIAIMMVSLILLQPHEGEGMGAVFGGSSGVDTFLGTKTISVLWKTTIVLGFLFIAIAVTLNLLTVPTEKGAGAGLDNQDTEQTAPENGQKSNGSGQSENGASSNNTKSGETNK